MSDFYGKRSNYGWSTAIADSFRFWLIHYMKNCTFSVGVYWLSVCNCPKSSHTCLFHIWAVWSFFILPSVIHKIHKLSRLRWQQFFQPFFCLCCLSGTSIDCLSVECGVPEALGMACCLVSSRDIVRLLLSKKEKNAQLPRAQTYVEESVNFWMTWVREFSFPNLEWC